jgi:hypothetical protein
VWSAKTCGEGVAWRLGHARIRDGGYREEKIRKKYKEKDK